MPQTGKVRRRLVSGGETAKVTAYHAALEKSPRERVPLYWAISTGNQGRTLMLLAERRGDAALAQKAVSRIEQAFTTAHEGGDAPSAAFYRERLSKARALLERLQRSSGVWR